MMRKPKYVNSYIDHTGKAQFYLRRKGCRKVPLPGLPWSPEFMAAYEQAMSGASLIVTNRIRQGTVDALVHSYLHSVTFNDLALETQRTRKNILVRFAKEHGDKRVAKLKREHVVIMFGKKAEKQFAARNWLKTVRALMQFAVSDGTLKQDPTDGIKNLSGETTGYPTWNEEDIAAFQSRHHIGTRERLALELLLCTAQRRSDVVKMGRQHIRNGAIEVRQQKTGTPLAIPIHPDLQIALDAMKSNHLTFMITCAGKPFTAPGFTNWFRKACNAAGLSKGTSAHGLRKAACRRLAEAGCSANVIASISGHAGLAEVARYTKAVDQVRMARDGMAMLIKARTAK